MKYNSSVNQTIKAKFVAREVYCNVGSLIRDDVYEREEIENLTMPTCPECGEVHATKCPDCGVEVEPKDQEILEWWAVSDYLYEHLKQRSEPVFDAGSCYVWGRTCSGQAILLDHVISQVCEEMEILEGQPNSWAK